MEAVGLAVSTVSEYLAKWIEETRVSDVSPWVNQRVYERVVVAFEEHGIGALKPVFEALRGEVTYDAIRIVRAHWAVQTGIPNEVRELAAAYD